MVEEREGKKETGGPGCCAPEQGGEGGICPMAEMCQGMMKHPRLGLFLMVPAAVLILMGILILLEPRVLVWLIGCLMILMGAGLLACGVYLRKSREG